MPLSMAVPVFLGPDLFCQGVSLPLHHAAQAQRRGIKLELMQPGMARRRRNSSRYEVRTRTVLWHLEWRFPAAGREVHTPQVRENTVPAEVLRELTALKLGNAARR